MLKNARKMRESYIQRIMDISDDIINVIEYIEDNDYWELFMKGKDVMDILFFITDDPDYDFGIDISKVYDFLSCLRDDRISTTKTVIEELEEIFEINYGPKTFKLVLKDDSAEED